MKLSDEQIKELNDIYQSFLNNDKIKKMMDIPQHRGSNCYYHSFKVAKLAVKRAIRHKHPNVKAILIGAILHDYYLYDWRVEKDKKYSHLSAHPSIALKNAKEDFELDEEIELIIKTHMWPINIKDFPKSKEARIVTLADKTVALIESLTSTKYKKKRDEKYQKFISTLF